MCRALFLAAVLAVAGCGGRSMTRGAASPTVPPNDPAQPAAPRANPSGSASLITHGSRARKEVALTFDADMTRGMLKRLRSGRQRTWYDAAIVRELRSTNTPATIFLTGLWTSAYPDVVRSLSHDRLFELENHSVDHAAWLKRCYGLPAVGGTLSKRAEIVDAADTIKSVAGVSPRYFRFPGGCHDAEDLRIVAAASEQAVAWDVVSGDSFLRDPPAVTQTVLREARPGSIVVMHLVGGPNAPATSRALPAIIAGLRSRGYALVTLRRLLEPA